MIIRLYVYYVFCMYFPCDYISKYLNYVHGIVASRMRVPM